MGGRENFVTPQSNVLDKTWKGLGSLSSSYEIKNLSGFLITLTHLVILEPTIERFLITSTFYEF